jgi:predicted MFS family arabinose efflux permease
VPGARAAILALVVGIGAGLYFALWFHWPTFLAVAVGAFMAIVLLMIASSLGEDPAAADAAWREAAPDLVPPPASPRETPRDSTLDAP